jgi:hypothetical protein
VSVAAVESESTAAMKQGACLKAVSADEGSQRNIASGS